MQLTQTVASFLFSFSFALSGILLSVVFLCSLYILFTFYSLNLFPNNDKKNIRRYQKLFCNLYKFVSKSVNSIKMDGNQKCYHVRFTFVTFPFQLYIVKLSFPLPCSAGYREEEAHIGETGLSDCADLLTI